LFIDVTPEDSEIPLLKLNSFVEPGPDTKLEARAAKLESVPYKFRAQLAPIANKLTVFADFLFAPERQRVTTLEITLTSEGAEQPVLSARSSNLHHYSIRDTFDLPPLETGAYDWTARLTDKDGNELATGAGTINKLDESEAFPWYFNICRQRRRGDDRELSAFSPTEQAEGGFHRPEKFARLWVGRKKPKKPLPALPGE
jgi:hypothetical protein